MLPRLRNVRACDKYRMKSGMPSADGAESTENLIFVNNSEIRYKESRVVVLLNCKRSCLCQIMRRTPEVCYESPPMLTEPV